jgi:hypothetical protein
MQLSSKSSTAVNWFIRLITLTWPGPQLASTVLYYAPPLSTGQNRTYAPVICSRAFPRSPARSRAAACPDDAPGGPVPIDDRTE